MLRAAVVVCLALGVSSTTSTAVAQRMGFDRERVTVDKERDAIQGEQNTFVTLVLFDVDRSGYNTPMQPAPEAWDKKVREDRRKTSGKALPKHTQAQHRAEATLCAREQAKYWRSSRAQQGAMKKGADKLQAYARTAGILDAKAKALDTCLTSRKYEAQAGPRLAGARSMDEFQQVIAQELAKKQGLRVKKTLKRVPKKTR